MPSAPGPGSSRFSGDFVAYTLAKKAVIVGSGHADGNGGGASVARGIAYESAKRFEHPAGSFANRIKLLKWAKQEGAWITCRNTGWEFSDQATSAFKLTAFFGTDPPCGDGYYGAMSASYILANGVYTGGWVWSGYCKMYTGMQQGHAEPAGVFDTLPTAVPPNTGPTPSDPGAVGAQQQLPGETRIELAYE